MKKNAQHDAFSRNEDKYRPSLHIKVRASGDVSLSLPRCFRGLISIESSYKRIAFSPAFEKCTALLSDVRNVCVYFVGDRPRSWMWCGGADDDDKEGEGSANENSWITYS